MISLRKKYWLQVFGWIFCIYSTLYIVRPICEFLRKVTPFVFLVNSVIIASAAALIIYLFRKIKITALTAALLSVIAAAYSYILIGIPIAEEKIHFLEYGFLAFLIYRAMRLDIQKVKLYVWVLVLTGALGWVDEIIQYFLPNRYFDWRDVIFNAGGGALGLIAVYLVQNSKARRAKEG